MQKYSIKQKNVNPDEIKVKEYMGKYIKELQRHFNLSDRKMRIILYKVYKDLSPFNFLKKFIKKWLSMLKSIYDNKIKRNKHGN